MKSRLWSVLWVFAFCLGLSWSIGAAVCLAEEVSLGEVVVTATRTPEPVEQTASSVTVITGEELEERGITTLAEALREVAGIAVVQNSLGGLTSVFVRGAATGQTVVMIDGVPIYDPSGLAKGDVSWILPHLKVDQIERIEIVRGPQSVLYGSNAMAGAINIITKEGKEIRGKNSGGRRFLFHICRRNFAYGYF